ncbi:MAG TPA: S41 family peptidase [Bryobacteraceae bacterium]|nr:S41 family peptidase [Bryobacteraceae bacterium]
MRAWGALCAALAISLTLCAQPDAAQRQLALDSFERVWTTIRDTHWEKNPAGLDWQAIHDEFRPKVAKAANMDEARVAIREMLARLHQTHFALFPATVYDAVREDAAGPGAPGIDLRILDKQAVVTGVDPGSGAERAGVRPGWAIQNVRGMDLSPAIRALTSDPSISDLSLTRAVLARLSGPVGAKVSVAFLDGSNRRVSLDLELAEPRGAPAEFGNLPVQHVWFETKRIEKTAYIRFNLFLDVTRVMDGFSKAIADCRACDGLVIDLRGNPGGLGAMAMGIAGFLVDKPGLRLGTMYMRTTTLNFVINPRRPSLAGPVAILIDAESASTSEIFAGGLKDLARARVFGTRSAAAALPSLIERLPNGDGFQHAIANYISEGGQSLEGSGVSPDVEVKLTRQALLAGRDPVLEAALDWIRKGPR